jgi:pimeloyl-ACP methyl ester carboxylesterase
MPDDYGDVLDPDWKRGIMRDYHPHDRSRYYMLSDAAAETAAAAGEAAGVYSDDTVLLLHGVGNSGAIYSPVMHAFGQFGTVVAPTMSPELLVDDVSDRNVAVATLVDWLGEVAPPPWRLFGHSMGGILSGLILRSRPDLVSSAVLLNSPLPGTVERLRSGDTLDRNGRALLALKGLSQLTRFGRPRLPRFMQGPELVLVRTALGGFVKHPGRLDGDIISNAILRSRTTDGIDFLNLARILPVWESDPFSEVPVGIVVGDDDPLVPLVDHEALADSYPGSMMHVAEECGHFVHLERPRFTIDAVTEFFRRTVAA